MTIFYFAYGSNLLSSRLTKRIPSAKAIGRAILNDWRVVFNKKSKDGSGKANLLYRPGSITWGCLYQIKNDDLSALDKFEKGYARINVQVQTDNAEIIEAETYVSASIVSNPTAYDTYKKMVISGASEHNFPPEYIEYLQKLPSKPDKAG